MDKRAWREEIRRRKAAYSTDELKVMSAGIIEAVKQSGRWKAARCVLLYHALPDEVDTCHWIDEAAKEKTVLLPHVTGETTMELCRYEGDKSLQKGAYGIMEPHGTAFTAYDEIDLAIVPGMAFDTSCHRLGRGKGYYDRLLPLLSGAYKIGICFPFQLIDGILPATSTDVRMDEVIGKVETKGVK